MGEDKSCDINSLRIDNVEKELAELKELIKELKAKNEKDIDCINSRIKEMEDKYNRLELLLVELKQDIKASTNKIQELDNTLKSFIAEQKEISNKLLELELSKKKEEDEEEAPIVEELTAMAGSKMTLYIIGALIIVIMLLLGVSFQDILKLLGK